MAPRRHLQRESRPGRQAISAKGSKVYLEGQIQTRKWQDQSGQDRYSTEVVLQRFRGELVLLDSRGGGGGGDDYGDSFGGVERLRRRRRQPAPAAARSRPSTATWTTTFRSDGPERTGDGDRDADRSSRPLTAPLLTS